MEIKGIKRAHLVGAGGINVSAVGKLLLQAGVEVSGSDVKENEQTKILAERGASIAIGHDAKNVPEGCDILIHTSAAPETNPEREEARRRGIPEMTNFRFLAEWFADAKTILVTGTHGKSTTTAMLALILEKAGLDPTVILGSKLPSLPDGNLRLSTHDPGCMTMRPYFVIEGDEYARHFLEFKPYAALINNIELDHVDVYPTLEDYVGAFREMTDKVQDGGVLVANIGDANTAGLVAAVESGLAARRIKTVCFGDAHGHIRPNMPVAGEWGVFFERADGKTELRLKKGDQEHRFVLRVSGSHNALNAAGATLLALEIGVSVEAVYAGMESFTGIWRRMERLGELDGAIVYSDYAHHPTAVAATLQAAQEAHPGQRLVLCFQPHHRNRTRSLFAEFVPSFDLADELVLCEIYDVAGRDATEDAEMSSRNLVDAVKERDANKGRARAVEYAPNPEEAVALARRLAKPGDVLLVFGAGDIDDEIRKQYP
jgi:UDP-N-acetylmuramate--alanine ligase